MKRKVTLVYFSPNGTTLRTLENVVLGMGDVVVERIDMSLPTNRRKVHQFTKDDIVLYGTITGALLFAPNKQIFSLLQGSEAMFVGVAQFGNGYYGVTLKQLQRRAVRQGFRVVALGAFIGQHAENKEVATNRPDEKDKAIQEQFGRDIMDKVNRGDCLLHAEPKTGWSLSPLYNLIVLTRQFQMNADYELPPSMKTKEIDTEKCIGCKTCEKHCPMEAVDVITRHFDLNKCVACYRCINNCPRQAITVTSKAMNMVVKDFGKRIGNKQRLEPTIVL